MGAGIAGQAQVRFPEMPAMLGLHLQDSGNHVGLLRPPTKTEPYYVAFPVKRFWYDEASLELIERSAHELMEYTDLWHWNTVLLPRPGCGNGRLTWDEVRPVIEPILDDRIVVVHSENSFGR